MKFVSKIVRGDNGFFVCYPAGATGGNVERILDDVEEQYNGFLTIEINKPYKSRTTGPGSQNNLFWKLVQIIGNETGEEAEEIERYLKMKAITKGYPYRNSKLTGRPVPYSMTKINTVEMSYLIDTAYEVISFLGLVLENELKRVKS